MIRICPKPSVWLAICLEINKAWENSNLQAPKPPTPLIPGGWKYSNDYQKQASWEEMKKWAVDYGFSAIIPTIPDQDMYCKDELSDYIPSIEIDTNNYDTFGNKIIREEAHTENIDLLDVDDFDDEDLNQSEEDFDETCVITNDTFFIDPNNADIIRSHRNPRVRYKLEPEADFRELDLSGLDLSGADLSGADLRNADLSDTNLTDTDLSGADLRGAVLRGAIFDGTVLWGAKFNDANSIITT